MTGKGYHTGQICLNGHVVHESLDLSPEYGADFCDRCGAKTITSCPKCTHQIRGAATGDITAVPYLAPSFCYRCGNPYPWTASQLKAAQELAAELEGLSDDDREVLTSSIGDLVRETPRTQVAIIRFKKLMVKVGKGGADAFKDILVNIVSEVIRKQIFP